MSNVKVDATLLACNLVVCMGSFLHMRSGSCHPQGPITHLGPISMPWWLPPTSHTCKLLSGRLLSTDLLEGVVSRGAGAARSNSDLHARVEPACQRRTRS